MDVRSGRPAADDLLACARGTQARDAPAQRLPHGGRRGPLVRNATRPPPSHQRRGRDRRRSRLIERRQRHRMERRLQERDVDHQHVRAQKALRQVERQL